MGINLILAKALLPMLCIRTLPSVLCLVFCGTNEGIATQNIFSTYGDRALARISVVIFAYSAFFAAVVRQQQARWRAPYDAEKHLEAENESSESMPSVVCDAVFWVAADGCTMPRSDQRLDTAMGASMQGARLIDFVPESERTRFEAAFAGRAKEKRMPVKLLPTTFVRQPNSRRTQGTLHQRRVFRVQS
jgi:hypothetical protein